MKNQSLQVLTHARLWLLRLHLLPEWREISATHVFDIFYNSMNIVSTNSYQYSSWSQSEDECTLTTFLRVCLFQPFRVWKTYLVALKLTVRSRLCLALSCQSSPKITCQYHTCQDLGIVLIHQSSSLASDISNLARAIPNTSPIEYNVLCKRLQSNISDLNCTYRAILSCSKAKCSFIAKLKVLHAQHSYRKWQSLEGCLWSCPKSLAIGV